MTYVDTETDHRTELVNAVQAIVERAGITTEVPISKPDSAAYEALSEAGFVTLGISEECGGSGGTLVDLLDVVTTVARIGAATPLIEHGVLASWLMAQSGLILPEGIATVALKTEAIAVRRAGGQYVLNGLLEAVPWASAADLIVMLIDGDDGDLRVATVSTADPTVTVCAGTDLVGAPLNDIFLTDTVVRETAGTAVTFADLRRRGSLACSAGIAGAARAVCELSLRHARDRTQFGRPLVKFQAIAQRLAELAALTSLVETATRDAARDASRGDAAIAVAAVSALASVLARDIAAAGHQIHGAIGFTSEYELGRSTSSLWSWRDRYGSAEYWADQLAAEVLDRNTDLWALLTEPSDAGLFVGGSVAGGLRDSEPNA